MSLDGLRAWIGEVERKLGMRTRVFLALATIAIGGAGAAIYLAIDTRDNAVSESDVQELQEQLEARIGAGGATDGAAGLTQLEAKLKALEAEVEQLSGTGETEKSGGSGAPGGSPQGASSGASGNQSDGGVAPDTASPNADVDSKAKLEELLEQVQKQNAAAEKEQKEQAEAE